MKLLVVFALFAAIAYALPVEEMNQDVAEPIGAVVDLEIDNMNLENADLERSKRQFGGYGGYGGYGGHHGGHHGGYGGHHGGGYGGYGGHHGGHHGGGWGK